jgi:hypothetical protein
VDLERDLELQDEYETTPLPGDLHELADFEGSSNFWQPTEQSCPTLLLNEVKGFESLDYRLRAGHYKILFDFARSLKKLVDAAKAGNALQTRFVIQVHGLSDRIAQPDVELGLSLMRALEVARFLERVLPIFDLHRAEPPKSRTDKTAPAAIEEVAMFLSAAGSNELLVGTHEGNRRVVISACSQQV